MRNVLICLFLVGCGAGKTEVTSSNAISSGENIFQDWDVAIPTAEHDAIKSLASSGHSMTVPNGDLQRTYDDLVIGGRLNLSQLQYGVNNISSNSSFGCADSSTARFSIAIYTGGQIIVARKCNSGTQSLYYKYTVLNGRVNVCGYDDAEMTLERGCMSN